jgi:hypothetical protein
MDFTTRVVDRLPEFDERSRRFAAVSPDDTRPFPSRGWACNVYNDQGREGACVGFAWSHELAARPRIIPTNNTFALEIYRRAQQLDYWPGEDYSGTSVLAGVKAVQERLNSAGIPYIGSYRWAFGIADVLRVLSYAGPVVLGIDWYYDMYTPNEKNYITPTGELVGGHAILAKHQRIVKLNPDLPADMSNIDVDRSHVRLHNSWGTGYGLGGDAFITVRNLNKLLQDGGEACIPFNRKAL